MGPSVTTISDAHVQRLKVTIERIEEDLAECKRYIDLIEQGKNGGNILLNGSQKNLAVDISQTSDIQSIVSKIEDEFKVDRFDSLSWLVSKKSKLKREEIILLLRDGGIVLPKSFSKKQIAEGVKQILKNRYACDRLYLLRKY